MRFLFLINVFFSIVGFSQNNFINTHDSIYVHNGQFYKKSNDSLFTGNIKFIKKNGIILSSEEYKNGFLIKEFQYYNKSAKGKIYKEKIYYEKKIDSFNPKFYTKQINKYSSSGEIYSKEYFDIDGQKILEENYKNEVLVYSCEYKNGKKDGKEICKDNNCGIIENDYLNGKKIKKTQL